MEFLAGGFYFLAEIFEFLPEIIIFLLEKWVAIVLMNRGLAGQEVYEEGFRGRADSPAKTPSCSSPLVRGFGADAAATFEDAAATFDFFLALHYT
ncbi:MAG: hypothetical protein JXA21_07795 [Anaerolineae bacterium]|nr:hypothetical protein [Anaerolineae bacterium]